MESKRGFKKGMVVIKRTGSTLGQVARLEHRYKILGVMENYVMLRSKGAMPFLEHENQLMKRIASGELELIDATKGGKP